ncbi:MAG: type II toxin-antitoxin system RelE/ParE family toxin [Streptomycetaceae bacterium]|nr:MAG: type II toxin-antitoxin system RelE/ParE family toxin [Streptomycetaceae bacterium]
MKVFLTPKFAKQLKRLHQAEKKIMDKAVHKIINNPKIGEAKIGDLIGVYIYKFKVKDQQWLMAYEVISNKSLKLLMFGPHENFYRKLK